MDAKATGVSISGLVKAPLQHVKLTFLSLNDFSKIFDLLLCLNLVGFKMRLHF